MLPIDDSLPTPTIPGAPEMSATPAGSDALVYSVPFHIAAATGVAAYAIGMFLCADGVFAGMAVAVLIGLIGIFLACR